MFCVAVNDICLIIWPLCGLVTFVWSCDMTLWPLHGLVWPFWLSVANWSTNVKNKKYSLNLTLTAQNIIKGQQLLTYFDQENFLLLFWTYSALYGTFFDSVAFDRFANFHRFFSWLFIQINVITFYYSISKIVTIKYNLIYQLTYKTKR